MAAIQVDKQYECHLPAKLKGFLSDDTLQGYGKDCIQESCRYHRE